MTYFDWWASFTCSVSTVVIRTLIQILSAGEDDGPVDSIAFCIVILLWHAVTLTIIHMAVTKVGTLVADGQLSYHQNAILYKILDQGIILLDAQSPHEPIYAN